MWQPQTKNRTTQFAHSQTPDEQKKTNRLYKFKITITAAAQLYRAFQKGTSYHLNIVTRYLTKDFFCR
jgi:uncharacterized protein YfiM (DUF2279 family)